MKSTPHLHLFRSLAAGALSLTATSASAQTVLLSDNFNTAALGVAPFNDSAALAADQSGSAATKDYNISVGDGWDGAFQRGNGGNWHMFAGAGNFGSTNMAGSLNYDIAAAANTLNTPLEIKFNMSVSIPLNDDSEWTSFTVGGSQNPFVNDGSVGFSSLFRDNGATQQFSNGAEIGSSAAFTDNQLITFVLSNAAGDGSAFNSDGATDVVKMYVDGSLTNTFSGLDLDATDQYISFNARHTVANIDNLTITALSASPAPDYDTWANSFDPAIGLATADDDNDGLTNFHEYAFGLTPNSGASVNPISVQLDKSTGSFSYTRRATSGLDYSVWYSIDLSTWTEDTTATEGTPILNGEVETVPVTITSGLLSNSKLFVQVRAN